MLDAKNLCKLVRKIPPDACRNFLINHFSVLMPELATTQNLTQQRGAISAILTALSIGKRQQIEQVAEGIMMLSDAQGRDALANLCTRTLSVEKREIIATLSNQCLRAIWFYENEPQLFVEAVNVRQADSYRQNQRSFSGFVAPPNLEIHKDEVALNAFHTAVAKKLGCAVSDVAIQLFCRLRAKAKSHEDTVLHQVSIHYNLSPESIDRVQESELVAHDIIRAASTHITYEPETGHLEVLSKERSDRAPMACLVAETLLATPFEGKAVPLKRYDYQSLASPGIFNVADEPVQSVKVTELGFGGTNAGASTTRITMKDTDSIYTIARELYSERFRFSDHHIDYAKLSIKLKKDGPGRQRTVAIVLRGDNQCTIKSQRDKDRALCDRLLVKWDLVKEVGDADKSFTA